MKKCNNCGQTYDEDMNFCPQCGGTLEEIIETVEESNTVCTNCNADIEDENDLVKSVKQNIENSQPINIIKDKAKEGFNNAVDMAKDASQNVKAMESNKKLLIQTIVAIIACFVFALLIVANVHTCEECEKTYIGKEYTISFFGETEKVCRDCYDDFSEWNW